MVQCLRVQQNLSTSFCEGRAIRERGRAGAAVFACPRAGFLSASYIEILDITVQINDYLAIRVEGNASPLLKSWKNVSY